MIWGIAMTSVQSGLRVHIEVCRFGHHRAGLLRSFWVSAYQTGLCGFAHAFRLVMGLMLHQRDLGAAGPL